MATINPVTMQVDVHHITRIEGHGNIVVNIQNGILEQCDLEIIEAPRYIESILRGQPYSQVSILTSRICGICAVSHTTTSLMAVEKALGVEPSKQTNLLRKLNFYGEIMDSHLLHVYMLVAPDLFGVGSVVPLAKRYPEVITRALRMKKLAGDICETICGRHTHPIAMTVGGFTHVPSEEDLQALSKRLTDMQKDVEATVELFQHLELPDFERDTEFIALHNDLEYCFIGGEIVSSDGGNWQIEEYKDVTNEVLIAHSTSKHARNQRKSYMVGALSRFKLNYQQLHPKAKAVANTLNLLPNCINPYMITKAQLVEIVHCYAEAIRIIQQLLDNGLSDEEPIKPPRFTGEGVAACEAPRGTLYHHFAFKSGYITDANCIIPTGQNLANLEADMRELVPSILDRSTAEMTMALEMLVRAYDPCISCSTHLLEVQFV